MNDTSAFSRVTRTSQALYGPRKLLICGFTPEGQTLLDDVVATSTIRDLPLAYAATSDLEIALADILLPQERKLAGPGARSRPGNGPITLRTSKLWPLACADTCH